MNLIENKKLNLYQKLIEVRKLVKYIKKDEKVNAGKVQFEYTKASTIVGLIRPKLDELGVLLTYEVRDLQHIEVTRSSYGKDIPASITQAKCVFTFINADNPEEKIERVIWSKIKGDSIQDMGSMQSYNLRYFLLGFFNIANDKDAPDTHERTVAKVAAENAEEEYRANAQKQEHKKKVLDKADTITQALNNPDLLDQNQIKIMQASLNMLNDKQTLRAMLDAYSITNINQMRKEHYEASMKAIKKHIEMKTGGNK